MAASRSRACTPARPPTSSTPRPACVPSPAPRRASSGSAPAASSSGSGPSPPCRSPASTHPRSRAPPTPSCRPRAAGSASASHPATPPPTRCRPCRPTSRSTSPGAPRSPRRSSTPARPRRSTRADRRTTPRVPRSPRPGTARLPSTWGWAAPSRSSPSSSRPSRRRACSSPASRTPTPAPTAPTRACTSRSSRRSSRPRPSCSATSATCPADGDLPGQHQLLRCAEGTPQRGLGRADRRRPDRADDALRHLDRGRRRPMGVADGHDPRARRLGRAGVHRDDGAASRGADRVHARPGQVGGDDGRRGHVRPRRPLRRRHRGGHRPPDLLQPPDPRPGAAGGRAGDGRGREAHGSRLLAQPPEAPGRSVRVLVLGATGYVGSRLVPHLLDLGHEVVAASSPPPDPDRCGWDERVEAVRCDVTDASSVDAAVRGVDAVVYLVHSLQRSDFTDRDRLGAATVAAAVDEHGVHRVVYLSGLVPTAPERELSAHISSRLEVERILLATEAETAALRAGVVIGAGSTSFEIISQIATLFVVQPVPLWMHHRVQPIAVSDVLRAIGEALEDDGPRGAVDIGGPDVLTYPRLMQACSRGAGLSRVRLPAPIPPRALVGLGAARGGIGAGPRRGDRTRQRLRAGLARGRAALGPRLARSRPPARGAPAPG